MMLSSRRSAIFIKSTMVIFIAIGFYKQNPSAKEKNNIGGILDDLNGIRADIKQVMQLFCKNR